MEILNKKGLLCWGILCLACTGFLACSDAEEGPSKEIEGNGYVPLSLRSEGISDDSQLDCFLYIFSRANGENVYRLDQELSPTIGEETRLPLEEGELMDREFRFLFVATPQTQNEIKVVTKARQTVTEGTAWEDIVLASGENPLTVDNYYDIQEITGDEILQDGKVEGHLKRLPGQVIFNFYKAGPGGVDNPVAVDPEKALSVFDRIYEVDITYKGYAWGVAFGAENELVPVYQTDELMEQTHCFTLTSDLQVEVPQVDNHLELLESAQGGICMPGACFLPTDKKLRIKMVFHYYDTTPICEEGGTDSGHSHTKKCYKPMEVTLNLPALSSDGLSVKSDYFTVNKAALPLDRVIDIKYVTGVNIETDWNINNSN